LIADPAKEIEMTLGKFVKSLLGRVAHLERAMDYDPLEAQSLRLLAAEQKLAELTARQTGESRPRIARPPSADAQ